MSLAQRLLKEHKNEIEALEILPSTSGVFEVSVDGKNVFSKKELNRFPNEGEVEALIREI